METVNITGVAQPIGTVHRPSSTAEVVQLVKSAAARGVALYPTSAGLNWGYGSGSPPVAGCDILDMSAMKGIRPAGKTLSVDNPVVVIEPGVTQVELHDYLQINCPQLSFNVTGSGRDTSLIGNALDRGVGYFGPRCEDLFGLEVVLGSGAVLRTGFRRLGDESPLAFSHPYGLGPMLDGLFFQGNYGVVTSACFKLIVRRPVEWALSFSLKREADLAPFIDALAHLKRDAILSSVTHIGNRSRTHASLMYGISTYLESACGLRGEALTAQSTAALNLVAPHEWSGLASVAGTAAQVRAAMAEIRRRVGRFAGVRVVTKKRLELGYALMHALRWLPWARAQAAAIAAVRPLHDLALGIPTDAAIDNLMWRFGAADRPAKELDQSRCGLLFINPALPTDGAFVAALLDRMRALAGQYSHELYVTVNLETSSSLVAVINLLFDRSVPEQLERAHRCAGALLELIHSQGLEVYRARADMMGAITRRDAGYWGVLRALKDTLDPQNIVSPGRYNL